MQTKEAIEITQLKSLSIDEKFFPDNLTNEEAALLYQKLKTPMNRYPLPLIINKPWQLYILARQKLPKNINLTYARDNLWAVAFHYLAWAGNDKELYTFKNHDLFTTKDVFGRNVLHYLILSGNAEGLALFKDHVLFTQVDNYRQNIFHLLAQTGNDKALLTFSKTHLKFFKKINKAGNSIAFYAALSKNPKALAIAWTFMGEDNQKTFYTKLNAVESSEKIIIFETVENALKNNYRLPFSDNVQLLQLSPLNDEQKPLLTNITNITELHKRNKAMDEDVISFKAFLQSLSQNDNNLAQMPREIFFEIFKMMFPKSVSVTDKRITAVFNNIFDKMNPEERKKNQLFLVQKNTASTLITTEINKLTKFSLNKMLRSSITQEKIIALKELEQLIEDTRNPFTHKNMKAWYAKHENGINYEQTPFKKFFQPEHIISTRMLVTNICSAFGFDEKAVTENPKPEPKK